MLDARIYLDDTSWVRYLPRFASDQLLERVEAELLNANWQWDGPGMGRRVCWFGSFRYRYDGADHGPQDMPPLVTELAALVSAQSLEPSASPYDGVLCNRYADGTEWVGFHQDNEVDLDIAAPVSILSTGSTRRTLFSPVDRSLSTVYSFSLEPGSLFVIGGQTQERWRHAIPIEPTCSEQRLSLTFRRGQRGSTPSQQKSGGSGGGP